MLVTPDNTHPVNANTEHDEMLVRVIKARPEVIPLLTGHAKELARLNGIKQFQSYDALRNDYWARIYDSVDTYLNSDKPVTLYRNSDRNLIQDYFQEAAELGYEASGGTLPLDEDTQGWVDGKISQEQAYIGDMFDHLRDDAISDYTHEAFARADGYAATLDSVYDYGKLNGAGNKMLTFDGDDGAESCRDCQNLKGQRHRASWWIEHELIPGPGNDKFECQGYNCDHGLYDDDGNLFTQ